MKFNNKLIFCIILAIGTALRLYQFPSVPSGLNWDEISHGYNAYSVLKTGSDQWGMRLPIFNFRAYGDYPTTANLYLTIPFVLLLGLNALSIRLPALLLGIGFIILNYHFSKRVFSSEKLGLLTMFLSAISPWTIFTSRAVFQSNLSQFLLLAGIITFIKAIQVNKSNLITPAILFSASAYSYHNARIIAPIIIIGLILINNKKILQMYYTNKMKTAASILILIIFLLPNTLNLFSSESLARNRWVGIINPNSINLINEKRRLFDGPKWLNLALNNKAVYFTQAITVNYLSMLNPIPIFINGSENYQFNPPQTGLIFTIFLPFFYYGLYKFVKKSTQDKNYLTIIFIFVITLFPATLTVGDFPSIRATSATPIYFLAIAYGLNSIIKSKKLLGLIIAISLAQLFIYTKEYFKYDYTYSQAWQYGYQEAVTYIKSNYSKYDQIIMTKKYGEPHEFVLFYWPWDPSDYQHDPNLKSDFHSDWYWVDSFDKFTFVNDWEIQNLSPKQKTLLITSPGNYPQKNSKVLKQIKFLDNSLAFEVVSYD